MTDGAASKHDGTTSAEASIELNKVAHQARYHRTVRKRRIAADAEKRQYGPISGWYPARTGYYPPNRSSP
jgi:hypothetical protein